MSFSCNVCHKSFKRDEDVYSHKIQKQGCSVCQYCTRYSFNGKAQIRRHMKSKHLDFNCSSCSRRFFLSSGRDTHERMKHGNMLQAFSSLSINRPLAPIFDRDVIYHRNQSSTSPVSTFYVAMPMATLHDRTVIYQRKNPTSSTELNTRFLSDLRSSGSLTKLLVSNVIQDPENTRIQKEIVAKLDNFMQNNLAYSVAELFKGGSSGKGTGIRRKSDLDLVVYINNYDSVEKLQKNMTSVLKNLRDHLKNVNWAHQVQLDFSTKHCVQVLIRLNPGEKMTEVDILPAIDIRTESRKDTFERMSKMSAEDRSFYSVSFAKDQVDFVKHRPDYVKKLIRLVKHWKRREDIDLVSYCIELIVIKQWEDGKLDPSDLRSGMKTVMKEISKLSSMQITWPERYDIRRFGNFPPAPAVMDPANPFTNTADGVYNVSVIENKAREMYEHFSEA